jgi:transposase
MKRFVEGQARDQVTLLPECLEDWADENNPVRVIDAFVEALEPNTLGFSGVDPKATGRPAYKVENVSETDTYLSIENSNPRQKLLPF